MSPSSCSGSFQPGAAASTPPKCPALILGRGLVEDGVRLGLHGNPLVHPRRPFDLIVLLFAGITHDSSSIETLAGRTPAGTRALTPYDRGTREVRPTRPPGVLETLRELAAVDVPLDLQDEHTPVGAQGNDVWSPSAGENRLSPQR